MIFEVDKKADLKLKDKVGVKIELRTYLFNIKSMRLEIIFFSTAQ